MDENSKDLEINKSNISEEIPESNAAHRIRMRGEMGEVEEEPELNINKWANFWYHNKAKIIIASAFAFILIVAGVQYFTRQNPDVYVIYAGPRYVTANKNKTFCEALEMIMDDYNGDGVCRAQLTDFVFMTDSQLDEYNKRCEEEGEKPVFDLFANNQTSERYSYEVFGGNASICILAEDQYLEIRAAGGFIPLSELFDEIPEGAYDDCGIRFSETKFSKFFCENAVSGDTGIFPDDAVIAIRKLSTMTALTGRKQGEKRHANQVDMFKRIINFEYPEGYSEPKK